MSGGAVFQAALRLVNRRELSPEANHDVLAVLEAGRTKGPLMLLDQAARDAGLEAGPALARAGALYCGFCAGNLCDDLIDNECTYLAEPVRMGPSLQYQLQFIMVTGLIGAGLPAGTVATVCSELARAASYSHVEIRTRAWTAPVYKELAERMAGGQWMAQLSCLWWGTPLEGRAVAAGRAAGIVGHVAEDIRSADPRFTSMTPAERADVAAWARGAAAELRACGVPSMDRIAASTEAQLAAG